MIDETIARKQIVEIGKRMHGQGMAPGQDGNISIRLSENEVLITPSRVPKGYMNPFQLIKVDLSGRTLAGDLPPSVETPMHLAIYREMPEIHAGIHAHPIFTVALSMAGIKLSTKVLPEISTIFGDDIPIARYATPGTEEMGLVLIEPLKTSPVVIQARHGIFSAAKTLHDAWYKAEQIEACAKLLYHAHMLGDVPELPADEIIRLKALNKNIPETPEEIEG
jgi:L-fuculose-phosphate aldolase